MNFQSSQRIQGLAFKPFEALGLVNWRFCYGGIYLGLSRLGTLPRSVLVRFISDEYNGPSQFQEAFGYWYTLYTKVAET